MPAIETFAEVGIIALIVLVLGAAVFSGMVYESLNRPTSTEEHL